jgi:hypothetical protein
VSGYLPAADAISDDLAAWAALGIEEPADVEDGPRSVALWLQDAGYAMLRLVGHLEGTGIHPAIVTRIFDVASSVDCLAGDIADLADFRLTRT